MNLRQAASQPSVTMLLKGGPQNGQMVTLPAPGERFQITRPATLLDPRTTGSYGLSHEGPGDVLVYHWEGWV